MWVELRDSRTNVLRFPIEQRTWPTLDLMRTLPSDVHEVLASAMAASLDPVSLKVQA